MTIDRNSPWRHLGTVPYEIWRKRILDAGGTPEVAARPVWEAAGDDSALMLAMLKQESSYASDYDAIPESKKNPWNLQIGGVGLSFANYVDAANAWRARLYDPNYKQGIYTRTTSIADLIETYAPKSDGNDTEGYIAGVIGTLKQNGFEVTTPSTPPEPTPGGTPMNPEQIKPNAVDAYVEKQRDGQGFNYGTRGPIVGLVIHETQGLGSGQWYHDFFSCPDGERCDNALVDWLIDRQGQLFEFQDPYNTNRIPWASGGEEQNGNAIGRAINAKYRSVYGGVNRVYAAVEMVKTDTGSLTQAQIQTAGKILAYVMAKAGYPANDWRYPDVLGGNIYTAPHHSDISQTTCRIGDADKAAIEQACTVALAAYYAGQTPAEPGTPDTPETPIPPPPITPDIIPGVDLAVAKRLFGIATGEDGRTYSYDPNGPVSTLWRERGVATGIWPALVQVWRYADGRRYFVFEDGSVIFDAPGENTPARWLKEAA